MDEYLRHDANTGGDGSPESHPLRPFIPDGAKVLMCGSFPPSRKRWSMNFYYPNFINDMWRIFGIVFFGDKEHFVDAEKKSFRLPELMETLSKLGVALSDTGREIVRSTGTAADKDLDIRRYIDLPAILAEMPDCEAVVTTGEKAASVIAAITGTAVPKTGESVEIKVMDSAGRERVLQHWRMPSSSRAYPMAIDRKARYYGSMFKSLGISVE